MSEHLGELQRSTRRRSSRRGLRRAVRDRPRASARGRSRTARRRPQRLDGLGVEALQLARVLAHRGSSNRYAPVDSKASTAACSPSASPAAGLRDVRRQQRLVARAVEIGRVERDARVAEREREARAGRPGARARPRRPPAARRPRRSPGASTSTWPALSCGGSSIAAIEPATRRAPPARRRRAPARASRPRRARDGAPATTITAAPSWTSTPSSPARATMSPRSVTLRCRTARRNAGLRGLGRALGRAQPLHLGGDQRRDDAQQRRRRDRRRGRAAAAGRRPRRRRAARAPQRPPRRSSARARPPRTAAATASTALERSIRTSDASSARAAARTTSGRPAPGLDGVGDRPERAEVDAALGVCGAARGMPPYNSSKYQRNAPPSSSPAPAKAAST